ncbi:MAG: hypothetical protein ACOCVJ_03555 [Verrucomicrobiota bacterium]
MHQRLLTYLRDNRAHIVEFWLTEADIPPPPGEDAAAGRTGIVPLTFFEEAVDAVIDTIRRHGKAPENTRRTHLDDFLGVTCACEQRRFGGRVCMELHDSGLKAFMSVFQDDWDIDHEFNALDRECCEDHINHALSGLFHAEILHCKHRRFRRDCPFSSFDHDLSPKS